jgi:3-methyladenine DNA glycosylase AlkD
MNELPKLRKELIRSQDPARAEHSMRFFKTGKGEYGHGDVFWGLTVPEQRKIARGYYDLPLKDIIKLLHSRVHEERFTALILMVHRYQKGNDKIKTQVFDQYLKNTRWINNWDLVDTSTPQIVGDYCLRHALDDHLRRLATSTSLWERRIAVLATFAHIRMEKVDLTLEIGEKLLKDNHDLIHKAVGWMLREAHKRKPVEVERFLSKHAKKMPRVMLRYAIERMPEVKRKQMLGASRASRH